MYFRYALMAIMYTGHFWRSSFIKRSTIKSGFLDTKKKYLWKMRHFHQIDFKFGSLFIGQLFCLDLSSKNSNSGRIKCYIHTSTWTSIGVSRVWHMEWIDIETKWVKKCNVHWRKTKKKKKTERWWRNSNFCIGWTTFDLPYLYFLYL